MEGHEWAVVEPIRDASMAEATGLSDKDLLMHMNLSDSVLELDRGIIHQWAGNIFVPNEQYYLWKEGGTTTPYHTTHSRHSGPAVLLHSVSYDES